MRHFGLTAVVLAASLAPAVAQAQPQPAIRWSPASSSNYSASSGRTIDLIVLHKVDGSLDGCESWFKNPAAQCSSHYVVDASEIIQCVRETNVAWHAGNGAYNRRSIGIENAGWTYRNDVSDVHYRRLASLVAWICSRYGIPADRQHIVGHDQVPNPNHPGKFGGAGGHDDPGPYWDWTRFMTYLHQALGTSPSVPAAPRPARPAPTPGSGGDRAVTVNTSAVNVRDAAWGTILGQAAQDTGWVRTGREDQGFIEIYFRGGFGWIYAAYTQGYSGTGAQVTADNLSVRTGASTTSNVVGYAHTGQVYVKVTASNDGQWTLIRYDANRRWIYAGYETDVSLHP